MRKEIYLFYDGRLFAEDQYFDSQGMFISTVLCLPIILNCCVLVVSIGNDLISNIENI